MEVIWTVYFKIERNCLSGYLGLSLCLGPNEVFDNMLMSLLQSGVLSGYIWDSIPHPSPNNQQTNRHNAERDKFERLIRYDVLEGGFGKAE